MIVLVAWLLAAAPAGDKCKGVERTDKLLLPGTKSAQLVTCSRDDETSFVLRISGKNACVFKQAGALQQLHFLVDDTALIRTATRTPEEDRVVDGRVKLGRKCEPLSSDTVVHPLDPVALLEPELGVVAAQPSTFWRDAVRVPLELGKSIALLRRGERRGKVVEPLEESLIDSVEPVTQRQGVLTQAKFGASVLRGVTVELKQAHIVRVRGEGVDLLLTKGKPSSGKGIWFAGVVATKSKVEAWIVFDPPRSVGTLELEAGDDLVAVEGFADAAVPKYDPAEH